MDTVLHNQTDRFAWKADDHRAADQWLYELTPSDLRELDEAVKVVRSRGLAPPGYSAGDFPIPTFGQRLARQVRQLEHGCGFFLLRGIPVDRYDLAHLLHRRRILRRARLGRHLHLAVGRWFDRRRSSVRAG